MLALLLTPAVLSAIVLAAHFLRSGQVLLCGASLAAAWLAGYRRPWAPRAVQVFLVLGSLEWVRTLLALAQERSLSGEPAGRMIGIMVAVIAVALLGAALLGTRRVLDRARAGAPAPPTSTEVS